MEFRRQHEGIVVRNDDREVARIEGGFIAFKAGADMSVDEAISYLRRQTRERVESIYYAYVLDDHQMLAGVVSFRQLMMARGDARVRDVMVTDVVTVHEVGPFEDGLYIAMEFVQGQNLRTWLRAQERPRPWREALRVFLPAGTPLDIVSALNAAIVKQMTAPQLREAYLAMSTEPKSSTPEELGKRLADGFVEVKDRRSGERDDVPVSEVAAPL